MDRLIYGQEKQKDVAIHKRLIESGFPDLWKI
jgi:hypothetical protein